MTSPVLRVHFAPQIAVRLKPELPWWAATVRDWQLNGDPDRMFGRDVYNSTNGYSQTWAKHVHVIPSSGQEGYEKWERNSIARNRTSDRLMIYSLSEAKPFEYGILLLALLGDPGGHDRLIRGAAAQERRQLWEDLAYAHQSSGDLPSGTETDG